MLLKEVADEKIKVTNIEEGDTSLGNTTKNGLIGQTAVLNRLIQLGHEVLLPWSPDSGYDLAYYIEKEEQHFGFFVHRERVN